MVSQILVFGPRTSDATSGHSLRREDSTASMHPASSGESKDAASVGHGECGAGPYVEGNRRSTSSVPDVTTPHLFSTGL